VNINEEAFLKVSFKNIDWFQIWKNYFSKKALKTNKILKNLKFFLHFYLHFHRTFQWYIVCFHPPNDFSYTLTLLPSHWPPLYFRRTRKLKGIYVHAQTQLWPNPSFANKTFPNEAFWKASLYMFWTSKVWLNSFMTQ